MNMLVDRMYSINASLDENNVSDALEKLKTYLPDVEVAYGAYDIVRWKRVWCRAVYVFGEKVAKLDYTKFVDAINGYKSTLSNEVSKEPFDFLLSEIYFNVDTMSVENKIEYYQSLLKTYPLNPEFWHDLGICHQEINLEKSISLLKRAYGFDESNQQFMLDWTNAVKLYVNELICDGQYDVARKYTKEICEGNDVSDVVNNIFILVLDRINDAERLHNQIDAMKHEAEIMIKKMTERSQFKIIEILSIFTAIITVIFSTVTIAQNYTLYESLVLCVALALVLMLFLCAVHLLFAEKKHWTLVLMVVVFLLSIGYVLTCVG